MKLHLPKLLLVAVLSCSMAQAKVAEFTRDGVTYKYLYVTNSGETISGDLEINHLHMAQGNRTVIVEGDTIINSNLPQGYDINSSTRVGNACQLQMYTTFESDSITFNCQTTGYAKTFSIYGNVKTDSFTVNATEACPAIISITSGGVLETRTEGKTGTFTIGANTTVSMGNPSESAQGTIKGFTTVVDGGKLDVSHYATMSGITLKRGTVNIDVKTGNERFDGVPLENPNDFGDIIIEGGTMTLDGTATTSDIAMTGATDGTSGTLNILGDVETGTLTLNSGTINVGGVNEDGEFVSGNLSTDGSILLDGATLNLNSGELADVIMNSGSIIVENMSTIKKLTLNGGSIQGNLSEESTVILASDTDLSVDVEGGEITAEDGSNVSGSIKDSTIIANGAEISATISGTSSVVVNSGITTISGANNDYSGGTVISGATLKLEDGVTVGTGAIELTSTDKGCGVFDMGGNTLSNDLIVTGCIIRNAQHYQGKMEVSHELVVEGAAMARKVTLKGEGTLVRDAVQGGSMTTDAIDVQTDGDASLDVDLSINDDGSVTLNNGKVLSVKGSLTLGKDVSLRLSGGGYDVGDTLLSSTGSLTMGDVILVYNDGTMELERIGNSLVLVSKFKQDKADAVTQGNWGIASASRAFVNTVRGQHSHSGCIANGLGTVWAAAFGSYNDMDGADINVKGAALGVDARVGACSTVGLAVGYADGEVSPAGLRDMDQEGTYVALYGAHGLKKLSSASCLSMDWVATYGNTESKWNGMDWEQDSLQLNTRLNWNKKVTDRLSMSVFGGLEYFATESDTVNGVKTGSIQNLRGEIGMGIRYVAWGTPSQTDGKSGIITTGCEKLVLNGEIRYMNDMVRSNPVIRMNGLSGDAENPGRQGLGIEAGATYRIGERWSASANYGFNAMEDSREHRVNVGASYSF